jgi:gamma-glutamyltranspeptidase / glutathione hydrolase
MNFSVIPVQRWQKVGWSVVRTTLGLVAGLSLAEIQLPPTIALAGEPVKAEAFMVSAANPYAVSAGYDILKAGGNSIDALVAVQLVLTLVEPQSSGIGGGSFLLYWDQDTQKLHSFDGRETAPLQATEDLFLDETGAPLAFFEAVVGGRSVGVPGTVKLLQTVHDRYGQLPWSQLFERAIQLAREGFVVSPRLAELVKADQAQLSRYPATREYFFPNSGTPLAAGTRLQNPELAQTLQQLATSGARAFYEGEIAQEIVTTVQTVPDNPGRLTLEDFSAYEVIEREPVCLTYRQRYEVCGMGPPSSGGVAVGQILGLLNPFDLSQLGPEEPTTWLLIGEAMRLAYADRERYLADPEFVPVPISGLLDPAYLLDRSRLIPWNGSIPETVEAGQPQGAPENLESDKTAFDRPSTSHISIVDASGNAVSMTTSIENVFGSRLMVGGFLLNNQLTDFAFEPVQKGVTVANRVEPGKRPRSSMSPTIVLEQGQPRLVLGSPGGSRIIAYVLKTLIAHLDWGLNIQEAIDFPHRINRFGVYELEPSPATADLAKELEALGYEVKIPDSKEFNSGLQGIAITPTGLEGGADPRREGIVMGE